MAIVLDRLSKSFGAQNIVDQVSLEIERGELFVLLGASGSGKSTILRLIAGLTQPTSGRILLNGRDVTDLPPQQRGTGFVFQNYSIFRHMSVSDNIEFGMMVQKVPKPGREAKRDELLDLVGLTGLGDRYAHQLSGGQQQRVALARALAYEPNVLLLDEPFGALDVKIRERLRRTLKDIQGRLGVTTILVTHDQEEALNVADRIGIVEHGHLLEVDRPEALYARPRSLFAATFLGAGTVLVGRAHGGRAHFGDFSLPVPDDMLLTEGSRALVLFRPEHVVLSSEKPQSDLPLIGRGTIIGQNFAGAARRLQLRLPLLKSTRQIAPPLPFGEEGLLVEAVLPAEVGMDGQEVWVCLRGWHILNHPKPRLLLYDAGAGPATTLNIGKHLMDRLNASATVLGVTDESEAGLDLVAALRTQKEVDLSLAVKCLRYGLPAEQIACEYAEALYEMVVVAVDYEHKTQPERLRETVQGVLAMTNAAVLVVKKEPEKYRRMLICTATHEAGKNNVRVGGRLARRLGIPATLLHVASGSDSAMRFARNHLHLAAATLRAMDVSNNIHIRPAMNPVEGILAEAREGEYDLIVVGSHGPGSRPPFALEDITLQVLAEAQQPVLVIPAEEV